MISVIMPAYNAELFICTMMDSLLAQTYTDFEIIAIDDGSTDNTFAVLQGYQATDKRVKAVTQANNGPSAARNKGISLAKGEFIAFVDADDKLPENYLLQLKTAIGDADMAICNRILHIDNENETNVNTCGESYTLREFTQAVLKGDENPVVMFQTPTNRLFQTHIILDNGLEFHTDFNYGEDTLFNLKYLNMCTKINTTRETSYIAYVNSNSLSHSQSLNRFDCYKEIRAALLALIEKAGLSDKESLISFSRYFTDNFFARAREILNISFNKQWKIEQLGALIKSGIVKSEDIIIARGNALAWRLLSLVIKTTNGKLLFLWFVAAPKLGA